MKYCKIVHTCGHTYIHLIYGSRDERESRKSWLATQDCPKCNKAACAAEHAAENAAAAETNKANGLPSLVGSAKQIAWAESIRAEKINALRGLLKPEFKNNPKFSRDYAIMEKIIDDTINNVNASFWIDNRYSYSLGANWLLKEHSKIIANLEQAEQPKQPKAINKGDIMRKAWQIAAEAAKKFGGKKKEYLSEAMKMAWAEARLS